MAKPPLTRGAEFGIEIVDKFGIADTYQIILASLLGVYLTFTSVTPIPPNPSLFSLFAVAVIMVVIGIYFFLTSQGIIDMPAVRLGYALIIPLLFALPLHIIFSEAALPKTVVEFFSLQVGYAWFWGFLSGIGADVIFNLVREL